MIGRRIIVVGTSGAGKTTLARALAAHLGCPHIELDAVHWGPNWTAVPTEVFRERVQEALAGEEWVADGNYGSARDLIWSRADTIVWLDFPLRIVIWRVVRRSLRRVVSREELFSGNRERVRDLVARDSVIWWALQTHQRRRRQYGALLAGEEYEHLKVIHLRSPGEMRRWWRELRLAT